MPEGEIDLEVGKEYTVYGIVFWDNSPWYYVCSENYDEYPTPFAAEFFSVKDKRLSSTWRLSHMDPGVDEILSSLVIEQWAKDPSFYERLLEGDSEAICQFAASREFMENEY